METSILRNAADAKSVERTFASPVVFITRKWSPAVGGMETYSIELTRELADHVPMEVIALAGRSDGSPPDAASLVRFGAAAAWRYLRLPKPPTVLHIGDLASWPLALLARLRSPSAAIVLSAHGTDVAFHRRGRLKGRLYGVYLQVGSKLLRNATLIVNSAATAEVAAETGWRNATVIPLATRAALLPRPESHNGRLLFAGRLVERKGCLWFVRNVLPLLPANIRIDVAGKVWDEEERAALDDPRVNFLGALGPDTVRDAYRQALCVVIPNIEPASGEFEGFGLIAPEASAAGGLVLAAASGGLKEAVIDGETGYLLPPGNAQAWADKIRQVATWPAATRQAFLERSMKRASVVYSWARVAEEVRGIYDHAVRAREGSAKQ